MLHHPHTTVKSSTWRAAWGVLCSENDCVKLFAGNGLYFEEQTEISQYHLLDKVLRATKSKNTMTFDLVINP